LGLAPFGCHYMTFVSFASVSVTVPNRLEEPGRNLGQQLAHGPWIWQVYRRKNRKGIREMFALAEREEKES